jgi:hypothetical protein
MRYVDIIEKHIDELERILIAMATNSPAAIRMLEDEKRALSLKQDIEEDPAGRDFYEPACYNALAVIRSAIEQEKINPQLVEYVKEAKDELISIAKYMHETTD